MQYMYIIWDYVIIYTYVHSIIYTYIVSMRHIINRLRNDTRLVNDVITSSAHVRLANSEAQSEPLPLELAENREICCIATSAYNNISKREMC